MPQSDSIVQKLSINAKSNIMPTAPTTIMNGSYSTSDDSSTGPLKARIEKKNSRKRSSSAAAAAASVIIDNNNNNNNNNINNINNNLPVSPNGFHPSFAARRDSIGKAPRHPQDEPPPKKRATVKGHSVIVSQPPPPIIDADGLSRTGRGTRDRIQETDQELALRIEKMSGAVRTLLECIGEDPDREGLLDTPSRYAKALLFGTQGYGVNINDIVTLFPEGHNEMVIVKDIEIHSLCEHHLVPFIGKMHIGYIPRDTVIGLSKLPRIAEMYARRLQIQERLTKEVANAIMEILKPQGVAVVMESSHLCMVMRGVQQTGAKTITSCVLGCFERKSKTRNEFLSLVGINR